MVWFGASKYNSHHISTWGFHFNYHNKESLRSDGLAPRVIGNTASSIRCRLINNCKRHTFHFHYYWRKKNNNKWRSGKSPIKMRCVIGHTVSRLSQNQLSVKSQANLWWFIWEIIKQPIRSLLILQMKWKTKRFVRLRKAIMIYSNNLVKILQQLLTSFWANMRNARKEYFSSRGSH